MTATDSDATHPLRIRLLLVSVATMGVLLRYYAATLGHNYDMESWQIAANLIHEGKNIYVHTWRYPYAPVWCYILAFLDTLSSPLPHPYFDFRHMVALFLCLVDIAIFLVLFWKKRLLASIVFILSPISILITGYHSQFDNLAVLTALLAASALEHFEKRSEGLRVREALYVSLILGLSITIKHVFVFFPFWLLLRQGRLSHKLLFVTVPYVIFFASFIPFWAEGSGYITHNVFQYRSFDNGVFYELYVPRIVKLLFSRQGFFLLVILIMAAVHKRQRIFDTAIYYCAVLLIFSSAITNQYLAIPVVFTAVNFNIFGLAYNIAGGMLLMVHEYGLHLDTLLNLALFRFIDANGYEIVITLLLLAWLWSFAEVKRRFASLTDRMFPKMQIC